MHEREHKESSNFLRLIQALFFASNIDKCHLNNYWKEKSYPYLCVSLNVYFSYKLFHINHMNIKTI